MLLAPSPEVAEFVSATYTFDRVELGPVTVVGASSWAVTAPGLSLRFDVGRRTAIGHLLRAQPRRLATAPWWTHVTDPVARIVLPGVRTRGAAREGRREYYGATDLHRITAASGTWHDNYLGALAPVSPDPHFGFGSTPRRPSVTSIVTTVLLD